MMFDQFLAQILIFSILAFSCARIFYIDRERIDSMAVVPPVAFVFSILTTFIFGATLFTSFALLLSIVCCMTNLRSLLRLRAKLIVDHYNPLFIVGSIFELILALGAIVVLVLFRPVRFDEKNLEKLDVKKTTFSEFCVYEPNFTVEENLSAVIFVPGELSSVEDYESYLSFLTKKGFVVATSDFYSDDFGFFGNKVLDSRFLRKSATLTMYFFDKEKYLELKEKDISRTAKKLEILYEFVREKFDPTMKIFIVMDNTTIEEKSKIFEKFDGKIAAYFSMENVPEYKTSGFGFPEQTNVILAKNFGLSRDKTFFISRHVANKTSQEFELFKNNEIDNMEIETK